MKTIFDDSIPCSLIVFKNDTSRTIKSEEQIAYARQSGLDFIPLKIRDGFAYSENQCSLRSFQRCRVSVTSHGGQVSIHADWDTNRDGTPRRGGQLWFNADKMGVLKANLVVSDLNRRVLVETYFAPNRQWEIVDRKIEEEVREEAIKGGFNKPQPKKTDSDEMAALKRQLDEAQQENRRLKDTKAVEPAKPAKAAKGSDPFGAKAREEIYAEKADVIDGLKKKYPQRWAFTPEFRKEIAPLIVQRREKLEREHANNNNDA